MAYRLSDYVLEGQLDNTRHNSTRGCLSIRGWKEPIVFELTGNPGPDLRGKLLYFQASARVYGGVGRRYGAELDISPRQFGAAGIMTAHEQVRVFEGSVRDFLHRSRLGEPPPTEWKRRLYIEWFGNNGRVVVELVDPRMCFLEGAGAEIIEVPLDPPQDPPFDLDSPLEEGTRDSGRPGADGGPDVWKAAIDEEFGEAGADEDRYGVLPDDFSSDALEGFGEDTDQSWSRGDSDEHLKDLYLMDELIERGGGMELGEVIGMVPGPESVSEEEAEILLKTLVGRLALYRVTYDVCEHCSAREAYRILVDHLAHECTIHPELRETEWVTHFGTSESCADCQREFEEEV